jgi:3-dehydroquinate dehydratase type I
MDATDPTAVLALANSPRSLPLSPAARRRVRMAEVRLDLVEPDQWDARVREAERAFPAARLLATLRLERDGGRWPDGSPRTDALDRALSIRGWHALDLESDAPDLEELLAVARRRAPGLRLVLSRHSFRAMDRDELERGSSRLAEMADDLGAAVAKWSVVVSDLDELGPDLVRILSMWNARAIPSIFPMGLGAEPWRVACALVGGGWGYGHDGVGAVAPGQLPWQVFDALLGSLPRSDRWDPAWFSGLQGATALALREEPG